MFNFFKKGSYFREFKCQFRISFPVKDGYIETNIIHSKVIADSKKNAKEKTIKWAKKLTKITVINIEESLSISK